VPVIEGGAVFAGGAAATAAVSAEGSVVEPAALEAVTCTRTVDATSAAVRVYVWAVALAMLLHPPVHRCH
jgi:hypothetical protein